MYFRGLHTTRYEYSAPVYLEPHTLRLRPRSDPRQMIHRFTITMSPEPDGLTEGLDPYGNDVIWAWFSGAHDTLEITTRFTVETLRENPYDYIVPSIEAAALPPVFPETDRPALFPFMTPAPDAPIDLAREVVRGADGDFVTFLRDLTSRVHSMCETVVRPEGDPLPASVTLAAGQGSCRDLAVVFIEACRSVGVPARFVSGYVAGEPVHRRELHAWGAVFVPGAGWRGYDPTLGLAVSDRHVTLAAAAEPAGAAPVEGRFRGSGVSSRLSHEIDLQVSADPASGEAV